MGAEPSELCYHQSKNCPFNFSHCRRKDGYYSLQSDGIPVNYLTVT